MAFVPGYGFGGGQSFWFDGSSPAGMANTRTGTATQAGTSVTPVAGSGTGRTTVTPTSGFQPNTTTTTPTASTAGTPVNGSLYGTQNPYHVDNYPIAAPPTAPTADMTADFLPPIFSDPYTNAINNATNLSNWYGAATPQAAAWQQQLYGSGMTDMEQTYAGAAAQLGARQLGQTQNRIANMFENSGSHGNLAPAMLDATNQHNMQINQMIGQMGTQRQGLAANLLPFTAGFPLQASGVAMGGAQGLYDMAQNAMYGDLNFPMAMFGSNPVLLPNTIVT